MQAPTNALFHRHLVLAYAFTLALHLAYLVYVLSQRSAGMHGKRPQL